MTDRPELRALLDVERASTEAQIASLTRTFDDVVESIEDVGNDDEHDPDGSTIAFERAQVIALLHQARANLAELDAAIERLASGRYGVCEVCGRDIPIERLEALPTTQRCLACAEVRSSRPG
jgi:RNA polymerase-binding transcription factor DksA